MKAARIHEFGGPEKIRLEEIPIPELKPGEALVRVHAAGLNPVDWMIRERIFNPEGTNRVPLTLGQDFSGVIERIAPGGPETDLSAGDAVLGETWGSFAEYAVVPVRDLVRKPPKIDFVTAASLPMPGLTAWQAVIKTARAAPGMKFLIHGAGGVVGSFAAQFALWQGARVYVTASRPSFEFLKGLGVHQIVDYQYERFEDKVEDVDVVIEHLGGETQERSWAVLKRGGLLINLVGEIDRAAADRAGVRAVEFMMEYDTADLREIVALVEQGSIRPHISKVLPLERVGEAMDLNQHNRSHGKIVLQVA